MPEELELSLRTDLGDEGKGEGEGTEPAPSPPQTPPSEDESNFLRLDRRSLHQEISRLEREDKEFANAFNISVGNKAKLKYQPTIEEWKIRAEAAEQALRHSQIQSLPKEEQERRIAYDPQFAREWAEALHSQPRDVEQAIEDLRIKSAVENLYDQARSLGLSETTLKSYQDKVTNGSYDDPGHWTTGFLRLQSELMGELAGIQVSKSPSGSATIPATNPAGPGANPKLAAPGPDNSRGSGPGTTKWTKEQVDNMNPIEFLRHFPGEDDYENAIRAGLITGYGKD